MTSDYTKIPNRDIDSELQRAIDEAITALEIVHKTREHGIRSARQTIQLSSRAIRAAHRGEIELARELVEKAKDVICNASIRNDVRVFNIGYLLDGETECAEAALTVTFLSDDKIPLPSDIGVCHAAYLKGLAEAASELRRAALDAIRTGNVKRADHLLSYMDTVMNVLAQVDFPEGVTGGLRRTIDQLRSVTERTRGDVTTALRQSTLEAKMMHLTQKIDAGDLQDNV